LEYFEGEVLSFYMQFFEPAERLSLKLISAF
jgi:hypothetical protein